MSSDKADLNNTTVADRYKVTALLGEGAMGRVYLAEDTQLQRQVALKVLLGEDIGNPEVSRRLEIECRLLAHLGPHPHIVTLHDREVYEGNTILVMEFVPGEGLDIILSRTYPSGPNATRKHLEPSRTIGIKPLVLTQEISLLIAFQCLEALEYAHGKDVLHRDIKPSNIMITHDFSGNITSKLMDFGIGKTMTISNVASAYTALTRTEGMRPGTPAYMSPEQIEPGRFGEACPATDIYSFGVMLFEMFTGRLPFEGHFTELMNAHTNSRPPSPRKFNPDISPQLSQVIIKSMQKSPANRFQSAGEMLAALKSAMGVGGPELQGSGKRPPVLPVLLKPEKRSLKTVFRLTAILVAVVVAAGAWLYFKPTQWITISSPDTITVDGLTLAQARSAADTMRQAAAVPDVYKYAPREWQTAEDLRQQAEQETDPRKSIPLYLESSRSYVLIPILAEERKHKSEIEAAEDAAQTESEQDQEQEQEAEVAVASRPARRSFGSARTAGEIETVHLGDGVMLDLVWIPPGHFIMGSTPPSGRRSSVGDSVPADETPATNVRLSRGFWMGRYEVTQQQWIHIMGHAASRFRGKPLHPVEMVSWSDCQVFIQRLNQTVPGGKFRLPTEAEWEYASRAGTNTFYHFSNDPGTLGDYAWFSSNSGARTQAVGSKSPNPWGLHDMYGNVSEWVQDWYGPRYYEQRPDTNPYGPLNGVYRVHRGGSWSSYRWHSRSAARGYNLPDFRLDIYGLRLVRDQ